MSPEEYLAKIERAHQRHDATEHTYRPDLKAFLESLAEVDATNEPKRAQCGAPDYTISRHQDRLTLGYVEAKDIGIDLAEAEKSEQLKRYQAHLPNLALTNYLEFRWYVRGERGLEKRGTAALGRLTAAGKIILDPEEHTRALALIKGFLGQRPVTINTASDLALRLAHLTHMVRDTIVEVFACGEASQQLGDWRAAFAATLLPELAAQTDTKKEAEVRAEFADMFAQTLAYGLFSARAAGPGGRFTREQARKLIPRTNPFLRNFFEQITGAALEDEPFAGFVDDIIQTLDHAGMDNILADFGKRGRRSDPVVHFYETFLQAYDPKLRELRGVYYTPEPVVNYIVESLDLLLKSRFGLKDGLADRSQITVARRDSPVHPPPLVPSATSEGEKEIRETTHRVLILDPATGTATFLYRVLDFIRDQFERNKKLGAWGDYVHEHLLPRLFGFELLMAPYAVAHFKLGLALAAWDKEPLFRQGLSYMVCDGQPLGERNPKWLHDDYVKFIRWAQWRIDQTGQGILAFITNHGYLDNPTFRGMRQSLMGTFDEIHLIDLHGNTKKKEIDPATGGADKNVFDIQQGVAIGIFVKLPPDSKRKKKACVVRHAHLFGSQRAKKYQWLDNHQVDNTKWTTLKPAPPNYFFYPRDTALEEEYERGRKLTEIMPFTMIGPNSHRDSFAIAFTNQEAKRHLRDLADPMLLPQRFLERYQLTESSDWSVATARDYPLNKVSPTRCLYRPFDERFMLYGRFAFDRPREELNRHLLHENVGLITTRQTKEEFSVFSTRLPLGQHKLATPYDGSYVSPLYLYPNGTLSDDLFVREEPDEPVRRPNLSKEFITDFCSRVQAKFIPDGPARIAKHEVGPEIIFHYAYAVFHSPAYRQRYAAFLRTDFPRLPLTSNYELFRELAEFGGRLLDLHVRSNGEGKEPGFPVKGDNVIEEVRYQSPQPDGTDRHGGRVWINDRQYFEPVPVEAWSFPIGGYQPAERWLKDRIGRTLGYDELTAYPRIIHALGETRRLMGEIDAAIAAHGGWPLGWPGRDAKTCAGHHYVLDAQGHCDV